MDLSIIVCTRNRASRLAETLKHYEAFTTKRAWELLFIDNASTDDTRDILSRHPLISQVVNVTRVGLGAARDHGWRLAQAPVIAFTDDDCYPAPDFVDRMLEVFEEHPEVGVVGGRIELWDKAALPLTIDTRETPERLAPKTFVAAGALLGANLAMRRTVLETIGGFDPMLGAGTPFPAEDIDVIAAALWAGFEGRYDPRPMVFHDHGRVTGEHERAIWRSYHAGRGAYYAKYMLRPDTRSTYARHWLCSALREPTRAARELASGLRYVRDRRHHEDQHLA